ncbi:MAG: hypothetical protein J7518_00640 [Nocardioidaceae bacterium]|nr:hypothetical protein [Nocardioidaceae bacterium]
MTTHPQRTVYLAEQRWFAGKGRAFSVEEVRPIATLSDRVRIELVDVVYESGEPRRETYQMPVVAYDGPQDRLGHALVREGDGEWTYDALHDRDAMAVLLQAFADGKAEGIEVHVVGDHVPDTTAHSTFLAAEQSNSSVVFGEESILKVFRKVTSGRNPDIEIHRALTEGGDEHVAQLYGWLSCEHEDSVIDLAMLQQFLRTASDGWELAKNSARNLFAEGDLHADEVGGDFAGEAHRLGSAVASVHRVLADAFGTTPLDPPALAAAMTTRLAAAVEVVPALAAVAVPLQARFAAVAGLGTATAHRVHGDLHLGQTLRTSLGWKLVDFEGEPAKPLAERVLPDSPWRDVAGMVRSFDYAAAATARDLEAGDGTQVAYRAGEWVKHNVQAFLDGYTQERGAPITPDEQVLLDAYVADKAVYETGYEARNRPGWLGIPLAALEELTQQR